MRDLFELLAADSEDFRARIRQLPVVPTGTPAEIREHLARHFGDFSESRPITDVSRDVADMLRRWTLHSTHPRYFGLFNPDIHPGSIAADALAAMYNPQVGGWTHAPAANEIERYTLDFLMRRFGFDPSRSYANYTSGGSEANHTAVLVALAARFPQYDEGGAAALGVRPGIYVSTESHHSFVKIARATGLGTSAVRVVPATDRFEMDVDALARRLDEDAAKGEPPLMVVATAGTTGCGAIDPIVRIADLCAKRGIWLHVDAAWGGGALLLPALRPHFDGIERADSVTWDAHKWLSVSMGAGMFFTRHFDAVRAAFEVHTSYVPPALDGTIDQYQTTMQWSRRFIGLKLFMTLAELGERGMQRHLAHQVAMGDALRTKLRDAGWVVVNDTPLPLVCFTHPRIRSGATTTTAITERVLARRQAWLSEVVLGERERTLRACITSYRVEPRDLDVLIDELGIALESGAVHDGPSPRTSRVDAT
jgi:glutamate/tyrosine decarboxylase-like PLP-dependent enzyme